MLKCGGGPELLHAKYDVVRFTRGKGLDIGRGPYKAFPHFVGIREKDDKTLPAGVAPDFAVDSFNDLGQFVEKGLDFIFQWGDATVADGAAEELLTDGGFFIQVWWKDDTKTEPRVLVRQWLGSEWVTIDQRVNKWGTKTACVVRYGGIGDMIQTAAIVAGLKKEGYHVTVNCHPIGEVLLRNDKSVDTFLVQDQNQVPNDELVEYWKGLAARYDKLVNLSESVEGTLLAHVGRANHRWPWAMRHKYLNKNYLEFMHEIAELPYLADHHFFPTDEEVKKADEFLARVSREMNKDTKPLHRGKDPYVIMWALAGSSVHKTYPHMDAVVAQILLEIPTAHIVFVGDHVCKILEQGWTEEPRITCASGEMDIRDVLTLAQKCQLVVGPETGTINSVAFETNAKIVMLSHSSAENLTRDWTNTESLFSTVTPCYPCHQLHHNREFCPQHEESQTAMCQFELPPSEVWGAVQRAFVGWGTVKRLITP